MAPAPVPDAGTVRRIAWYRLGRLTVAAEETGSACTVRNATGETVYTGPRGGALVELSRLHQLDLYFGAGPLRFARPRRA